MTIVASVSSLKYASNENSHEEIETLFKMSSERNIPWHVKETEAPSSLTFCRYCTCANSRFVFSSEPNREISRFYESLPTLQSFLKVLLGFGNTWEEPLVCYGLMTLLFHVWTYCCSKTFQAILYRPNGLVCKFFHPGQ